MLHFAMYAKDLVTSFQKLVLKVGMTVPLETQPQSQEVWLQMFGLETKPQSQEELPQMLERQYYQQCDYSQEMTDLEQLL